MRVLHVTDTHLGVVRPVRGGPRGWSRAKDHLDALRAALAHGEAVGAELIVHSGDLFDRSKPPARAVVEGEALLRAAARWARVLILPGNHDRRGLTRWLPHPSIEVHDRPACVDVRGVRFGLVPFHRTAEAFASAARSLGEVDLLVAHQAFDGAKVPGLTFRVGAQRDTVGAEHLPSWTRFVMCGHLHPRQVTVLGEATVVQPGAAERTSWSERAQAKGWAVWELDGEVRWSFVDGPSRPMIEVLHDDQLGRVTEGALVRSRPELEPEVLRRGGWLDGPPPELRASSPRAAPPADASPQLGLFARSAVRS